MNGLTKGLAVLSLGALAFAAPLHAQGTSFSLGGSLGLPLGDFGDGFGAGFHGVAAVSFAPPTLPIGIQVDGNFAQFSADGDADVKSRMLFATANAVYKFKVAPTTRIAPYLIGGLGVYNGKLTGDDAPTDESATDFGINAGAGFNISAGAASLFVEGRFHNVFGDGGDLQFIPLTFGVRFGG